jgi:hypothetical protein
VHSGCGWELPTWGGPKRIPRPAAPCCLGRASLVQNISPPRHRPNGTLSGRPVISWNAFLLLLVNILGLDILGGMVLLWLYGVRSRFHNLETTIRRTVESTLTAILGDISDGSIISVTLLDPTAVKVHATVRHQAAEKHLATLARNIGDEIKNRLGYRTEVMVETIPCQTYSTR